jgi:hypothetical protein
MAQIFLLQFLLIYYPSLKTINMNTLNGNPESWSSEQLKEVQHPEAMPALETERHGKNHFVIPYEKQWAIKVEGIDLIEKVFPTKKVAVEQARKDARAVQGALTIQNKAGKIERRISYNPDKNWYWD